MEDSDSDYYSDSSGESPPKSAEKKNESAHQTALLPKSFFPENAVGVGKECKIKQVEIFQDEVSVRYVRHDSDKPKSEAPEPDNDDYA